MLYMIHSCDQRLWYVKQHLIPSLVAQGIPRENIILWNDYHHLGNQRSFYYACKHIALNEDLTGGMWHLTDDAYPSHDFAERTADSTITDPTAIYCRVRNRAL